MQPVSSTLAVPVTGPAPSLPSLAPVCRIPISARPGSQLEVPSVEFDSANSLIYLHRPTLPWYITVRWYAPDVALGALLLCLLWTVFRLRRIARRPEQRGRLHCRRCTYDLTPAVEAGGRGLVAAGLSIPERCPECGTETARKRPLVGRSRLWRVSGGLVALSLVLFLCVCVGLCSLQRYVGRRGFSAVETWPVPGIETTLPGFALQKIEPQWPEGSRLVRYAIPSGASRGTVGTFPRWDMDGEHIAPAGRWCVVVPMQHAASGPVVTVIDLQSGASREVPLPSNILGATQCAGFSPDGERAYIQAQQGTPNAAASAGTFRTLLLELTVATGAVRTIAEVETEYSRVGGGVQAPNQRFALADGPGKPLWALATFEWSSAGTASTLNATVLWSEAPGRPPVTVPLVGRGGATPMLSGDGATLTIPCWGVAQRIDVDLRAGTLATVPEPAGPLGARSGRTGLALGFWGASPLTLVDTRTGQTLATLSTAPAPLSFAWLSADGRWAAAFVTLPNKPWFSSTPRPVPSSGEVLVWDLQRFTGTRPNRPAGNN